MSKIKLANELKRLLPGQQNSRIRQAIMEAYQRATGAPSLHPEYYQTSITEIISQIPALNEDYTPSEGTILFDMARSYGFDAAPVTGNIITGVTNAKEMYMAKLLHNDSVEPNIAVPDGVELICDSGGYISSVNNYYWFVVMKNNAGVVTEIHFTITQNIL